MKYTFVLSLFIFISSLISCRKSAFLDAKPDESLVIPSSLRDYQTLLDNDSYLNGNPDFGGFYSWLGDGASDDFYAIDSRVSTVANRVSYYMWNDNHTYATSIWQGMYRAVLYANLILDGIDEVKILASENLIKDQIKGSALFYRAFVFYMITKDFTMPYDSATAGKQPGIPLRVSSIAEESLKRGTLQDTYTQIINDLKESAKLLPNKPLYKTRPSKPAAYAMLAKTYLAVGDYANALVYANLYLELENTLINFRTVIDNGPSSFPLTIPNDEVIFYAIKGSTNFIENQGFVDSTLYRSYNDKDLRKKLFFKPGVGINTFQFRGSYVRNGYAFCGIATDEILLIRAEMYARKGDITSSMNDLNKLMVSRWIDNISFVPFTAFTKEEALNKVLSERRKELITRGTRWTDLRRFNKEGFNIKVTRVYKGQLYELLPNSLHYAFLIPNEVMGFHPDWLQNSR